MTAQPPQGPPPPPVYPQQQYPQQYGQHPQQPYGQPPQKSGMSTGCIVLIVVAVLAVPVIGVVAALGIYGVRRYTASSKTSEAKNTVGAISRGAAAAYERTSAGGTPELCKSDGPDAPGHGPVPTHVPRGKKYQPSSASGRDFETGGPKGGWHCLKFALTQPHYYQYHYNAGGNYVTSNPALPGADGYEAAAIGDMDGDGKNSEFSSTGKINPSGKLRRATHLFIQNEFE